MCLANASLAPIACSTFIGFKNTSLIDTIFLWHSHFLIAFTSVPNNSHIVKRCLSAG